MVEPAAPVRFHFDLAGASCYLVAEQVIGVLGMVPEWRAVDAGELPGGTGEVFRCQTELEVFQVEAARRALRAGLQPLRWPPGWPEAETELALRAATYARSIGRGVAFAQAAFRQAFAGGRDLRDPDTVAIAGVACEMHPRALLRAVGGHGVRRSLTEATDQATAAGVRSVPAITVGSHVFHGEQELAAAAAAVAELGGPLGATG